MNEWMELLIACKQVWVTSNFIQSRWPLKPVATDDDEWEVVEHVFSDGVRDEQTRPRKCPDCWKGEERLRRLDEMVKKGEIRPCGVRQAMEYVAAHLDIQLNHWLVVMVPGPYPTHAWGSTIDCLPVFCYHECERSGRKLSLYSVKDPFDLSCGWLVLRRKRQ